MSWQCRRSELAHYQTHHRYTYTWILAGVYVKDFSLTDLLFITLRILKKKQKKKKKKEFDKQVARELVKRHLKRISEFYAGLEQTSTQAPVEYSPTK